MIACLASADLVNRRVAVIVAGGAPGSRAVLAAQAATRTNPDCFHKRG